MTDEPHCQEDWQNALARSRWLSDRAYYAKAIELLRDTLIRITGRDKLEATLELSNVLRNQGYQQQALNVLKGELAGHATFSETTESTPLLMQMKMEVCWLEPLMSLSFRTSLVEADDIRSKTGDFEGLEGLETARIETALSYAKLRFISSQHHKPTAAEELKAIIDWMPAVFDNLVCEGLHREAYKLALAYGSFITDAAGTVTSMAFDTWHQMVLVIISTGTALQKASIITQLIGHPYNNLDDDDNSSLMTTAIGIYNDEGHVTGAMDIRCQRISRSIKQNHRNLTEEVMDEFKGYRDKYTEADAPAAQQVATEAIVRHIPSWLAFELQMALFHDLVQLAAHSGCVIVEKVALSNIIARWLTRSGLAPRVVEATEALDAELMGSDCTLVRALTANCAAQAYLQLHDPRKALYWADRTVDLWQNEFPSHRADATNFVLQTKLALYEKQSCDAQSVISYAETEIQNDVDRGLLLHAQQKREMIAGQIAIRESDVGRGWIVKTQEIMVAALKVESEESDMRKAALCQIEAARLGSALKDASAQAWEPIMTYFENAVVLYMKHQRLIEAANTRLMQSRAVFRQFGLSPSIAQLQRCLELTDVALDLFEAVGNLTFMAMATYFRASTILTAWLYGWSKGEVVLIALNEAEQACARQRSDFDVFAGLEAVSRRQTFTSEENLRKTYHMAFQVCQEEGRAKELWEWTQKAKARSLSDQLGIDSAVPADILKEAMQSSSSRELIEKEKELYNLIITSPELSRLALRAELDIIRHPMQTDSLLRSISDVRNGIPVKFEQIKLLARQMKAESSGRDVAFVDWLEYAGRFWLLVLRSDDNLPTAVQCSTLPREVIDWKKEWLDSEPGQPSAFEEDNVPESEFCLRSLDGLVAPLEVLTKPGDLLVFCPTGILHSIPLHALWLPCDTLILDRHPIVYSVSLTTFWQCCSRTSGFQSALPRKGSPSEQVHQRHEDDWLFSAVYEPAEGRFFGPSEREAVYKMTSDLAADFGVTSATGLEVTRANFRNSLERARSLMFFGHCILDRNNVIEQSLEVADGKLVVRDIFSMKLKAPHITLIACDSASQSISAGDEPLGVVTALLCAGAGSVLGTIWPTASRAGRCFAREFYGLLRGGNDQLSFGVLDLAEMTRKAVLAIRDQRETRQPYHWAAFVLHGSWAMYHSAKAAESCASTVDR